MKLFFIFLIILFFSACSKSVIVQKNSAMPDLKNNPKITIFALSNYTDTPQAGLRASNIIEGVLLSKNYKVFNAIGLGNISLKQQLKIAKENNSDYILNGGVSEWRYKTGIDGEPAISLNCKFIDTNSTEIIWSVTASSNDWGNASIGTTAQSMIILMFETKNK